MRFIDKLIKKRDDAHAEYIKWQGMIDALENDPEFASVAHFGRTKIIEQARAMANGINGNGHSNGNGNGHAPTNPRAWSEERRAHHAAMMRDPAINPMKKKRKKASKKALKANAARLRAFHKDPAWQAKRLKGLRAALAKKKRLRQAEARVVSL